MRSVWSRAGLVLAVVLLVDQVTKALVRRDVRLGSSEPVFPLVELVHVRNRGVAFGALENSTLLIGLVIAVALVALLAYFVTHLDRPWVWLPTGLLVGGAVGNLVDRIREGFVTDFVKLPYWPAFNVADMAITVGVVVLVIVVERSAPDAGKEHDDARAVERA